MIRTPLYAATRACDACSLRKDCQGAVPAVGPTDSRVMLVGEAPGGTEDKKGEPFTGDAGAYLDWLLGRIGVDRDDVIITNTTKCRPRSNRTPTRAEAKFCASQWLDVEVRLWQPEIIVAMGAVAIQHFLGEGETVEHRHGIAGTVPGRGKDGQTLGPTNSSTKVWPSGGRNEDGGRVILPVWHPAAGLHNTALMKQISEDFDVLRRLIDEQPIDRPVDDVGVRYTVGDPVLVPGPVAVDTETVDGRLWSVQYSQEPGRSVFQTRDGVGPGAEG